MALKTQVIDIPLAKGVDESVDAANLDAPALLVADNAVFTKSGSVRKRRGFENEASSGLPSDTSGLNRVFERAEHPVVYGKGSILSYAAADSNWHDAGNYNAYPAEVEFLHGFSGKLSIVSYDAAIGGSSLDMLMEVWATGTSCWYRVTDLNTKAVIQPPTAIDSMNEQVSVVWMPVAKNFVVFGIGSGTLYRAYSPAATLLFSTPASVSATVTTYAVKKGDSTDYIYIAYIYLTALYVAKLTSTGATSVAGSTTALTASGSVDIWPDEANSLVYFCCTDLTAGTLSMGSCADTVPGSYTTATGKLASSLTTPDNVSCAISLSESGDVFAAASYSQATVSLTANSPSHAQTTQVHTASETVWALFSTQTFTVATDVFTIPWYMVNSQCTKYDGEEPLLCLAHYSRMQTGRGARAFTTSQELPTQRHTFLVTYDSATESVDEETGIASGNVGMFPVIVAKIGNDTSDAGAYLTGVSPHLSQDGTAVIAPTVALSEIREDFIYRRVEYYFIATDGRRTRGVDIKSFDQALLGVRLYRIETTPLPVHTISSSRTCLISGGYLQAYDGVTLSESCPLMRPDFLRIYSTSGGGVFGPKSATTDWGYTFRALIVFRDANGIEHFGEPSEPYWYWADATDPQTQTLYFRISLPGLSHVRFDRGGQAVVQLYMAEDIGAEGPTGTVDDRYPKFSYGRQVNTEGGPWHLIKEDTVTLGSPYVDMSWTGSNPGVGYVNSLPLLYTEGGVLSAKPPPALKGLVQLPNRLVGISAENTYEILSTKKASYGRAAEWNPALSTILSPTIEFTALAAMDEKVLVFSRDHVYLLPESQADNTGAGGLPAPQLLSSDTGCIDSRSVVEGPFGVIFRGARGFYNVDRGLNLSYIGRNVEDTLLNDTITSAVLVPYDQVVRFTSSNDVLYTYDYVRGDWNTRTSHIETAAMIGDVYTCGKNTAGGWLVFKERTESDTVFSDVDTPSVDNYLDITTSWIKLAGLQGYKRLRRIRLLLRALDLEGSGQGSVVDGGVTVTLSYDYNDNEVDQFSLVLDPDTYGEDTPIFIQLRPSRQKCTAIKIRITEDSPRGLGEPPNVVYYYVKGFAVNGLSLEVGLKDGGHKDAPFAR